MCERVRESRRETDKSGKRINKIYRRKREKERGREESTFNAKSRSGFVKVMLFSGKSRVNTG